MQCRTEEHRLASEKGRRNGEASEDDETEVKTCGGDEKRRHVAKAMKRRAGEAAMRTKDQSTARRGETVPFSMKLQDAMAKRCTMRKKVVNAAGEPIFSSGVVAGGGGRSGGGRFGVRVL